MLTPYGLDILESCLSCKMRAEHIFCDLPAAALQTFETMKYATAYPKGAVLFVEGQAPRGIFVLCKGRVKLSICASDGKTLILKIAEAGEVSGTERQRWRHALRVDGRNRRSVPGELREARRFPAPAEGAQRNLPACR